MSTKEKILDVALSLFAEKGYDGVGVDEIAAAVGIKGPSLYKHFRGKEALLEAVFERSMEHYNERFTSNTTQMVLPQSREEIVAMTMGRMQFTMHDPMIRQSRKFLVKEQYRNERIASLMTAYELTGVQKVYTNVFQALMAQGKMKQADPDLLAMEFVCPITVLLHVYDRFPEQEREVLQKMEQHVRHFLQIYEVM